MDNTTYIIVHTVLYVSAASANWAWTKISYSKGGQFESLKPGAFEIFIMLCPFWNIGSAATNWLLFPPGKKLGITERPSPFYKRFFRIN
jgi:hypothetical protein